MEKRGLVFKAKMQWHVSRRIYYAQLLKSCLDLSLKEKLQQKMNYHTCKIKQIH